MPPDVSFSQPQCLEEEYDKKKDEDEESWDVADFRGSWLDFRRDIQTSLTPGEKLILAHQYDVMINAEIAKHGLSPEQDSVAKGWLMAVWVR